MSIPNSDAPVIIRRKKVVAGGGHHGGAWKVAYADFVTAMMAFFLLMWLLNATTEEQRKGIADYFDPKIPIGRVSGGGDGVLKGESIFADDVKARIGTGAYADNSGDGKLGHGPYGADDAPPRAEAAEADELAFAAVQNMFHATSGESTVADELMSHVRSRVTDEGLIVELIELPGAPLFEPGAAVPTERMRRLLDMVAGVIGLVSNRIAITGHTDSILYAAAGYSNWELSSERAHVARRALAAGGVDAARLARVTGAADRQPANPASPADPSNRRIEITLLRSDSPAEAAATPPLQTALAAPGQGGPGQGASVR